MRSESWIVVELSAAILLLAILSFFWTPAYEKGVWFALGAFVAGFNLVLGYKFGKNLPQQATDVKEQEKI